MPVQADISTDAPLLAISGLTKSFPGARALDDVSFDVNSGEIVALVGQNGSGKSTLVKTLSGLHQADPGSTVWVRGERLELKESATPEGLHFIHQDLGLVADLTAIENLSLSHRLGAHALLPFDRKQERSRAQELIGRFGASFDVGIPVAELSAEERTIVAIARALDQWTRPNEVLVLDEPTAALERGEVARLFTAVKRVAAAGAGVIFISHRLDEVLDLADRVVALRDGRLVADLPISDVDHGTLIRAIAGRDVDLRRAERRGAGGQVVLDARDVSGATVQRADLSVRAGEVIGVCGILGSGRESLNRLLFGALPLRNGDIRVGGKHLDPSKPGSAIKNRVAFVPADRHVDGAIMDISMRENLTLPDLSAHVGRFGQVQPRQEKAEAASWAERLELKPPQPERPLLLFSGGNQQKVVMGMRLRTRPQLLLLDEPTQGVDIGAKASLYQLITDAAAAGAAVVVSSSDMKELALVADRVVVMRDGHIACQLAGTQLNEEELVRESLGLAPTNDEQNLALQTEVGDD